MKERKGLTLVEVIVSFAILGIIIISFLSIITNNFLITNKTMNLTKTTFETQESLETKIDNVKKYLINDEIPPVEYYKLGQINIWSDLKPGGTIVKYYEVSNSVNNKTYATLVSDTKPKIFETISLESISLQLNKPTKTKLLYGYGNQSISAVGSFKNDEKYRYSHLTNVIEWYISDEKFIMPIPNDEGLKGAIIEDIHEVVHYYPLFPRDFIVVKNDRIDNFGTFTSEIGDITPYIGKHLIYTVTPGSKAGKIGKQSVSDAIFISGLPITQNLMMHFDANFIDDYNSNELDEIIIDSNETKYLVNRWYNLYSMISVNNENKPNEYASSPNENSKRPELLKTERDEYFRGQFVRFENGKSLTINKAVQNEVNLFVVARNNDDSSSIIINNNNDESDDEEGLIKFKNNKNNKWELVEEIYEAKSDTFVFGNAKIDIAEIIVYKGILSQADRVKVIEYLNLKYGIE